MVVTEEMALMALNVYDYAVATAPAAQNRTAPMRAALTAALASMWRPIEEAPRDGTECLFYWPNIATHRGHTGIAMGRWACADYFDSRPRGWNSPECGFRMDGDQCIPKNQGDITHFMPLPAPPVQQKEGA